MCDALEILELAFEIPRHLMTSGATMSLAYDPEWTALSNAMGAPPPLPDDVETRVAMFNGMLLQLAPLLPPTDPGVQTLEVDVNSNVNVRIYTPAGSEGKHLPLVIFFHGGGWQAGNLDTEDHTCRTVCAGVKCILVSCNYRKAPQVKFPVPIDDCYAGYQWAVANANQLGADPNQCILSGGSAGGGLAIAVTYRAVQHGEKVTGLVLMSPFSLHPDTVPQEYAHLHKAYVENADAAVVDTQRAMDACKVVGALPPDQEPSWFPQTLGSKAFKGFPRTWIFNTELECFRDDGAVLKAELEDAGVPVKREVMEGFPHYFWCFPIVEGGKKFRGMLIEGFQWVIRASEDE